MADSWPVDYNLGIADGRAMISDYSLGHIEMQLSLINPIQQILPGTQVKPGHTDAREYMGAMFSRNDPISSFSSA